MKKFLSQFVTMVSVVLLSSINSFAQSPTAPALGFNAFLQQNATLVTNESEGPIAIGGDLTVNGNYQVNIHNNGTFAVSNVPIGLFVGGKVNLSSGSLQVNSGRYVKIGNCASSNIKTWYRDNNNATSNIYITGSAASYASTPNININSNALAWGTEVSAANNPVCDANTGSEISFSSAFTTMKASATSLSNCTTTGNILSNPNGNVFGSTISSVLTSGQVKITLATGTNVLNVSGSDLNSVTNGITFTNSPDASHVLVINVNAAGSFIWNVWNQAGISGNNAPYIIYNFYNTTSLSIAGNSTIEGTVFAPNADITKTVNQSNIEGQVISQSLVQSGGELHYYPFTPSISGCSVSSVCSGFTTYTQGGWGAAPKGNNPGTILQNNFAAVYPSGVNIGCSTGYTLRFTSSSSITAFLPQGTTPAALTSSAVNPTATYSVFAGQVLAARLNVDFDKYNPSGYKTNSSLLSTLVFNTGVFNGKTVQFVLDEANKVLGGCSSTYSAADLNDALTLLNQNYDNGGGTNVGNLNCGSSVTPVAPVSGSSFVCVGSTTTLTDATAGGTWSSSDNTIATVTSGGGVTGFKGGSVTITYSVAGYSPSATLSFTVKATSTSTTNASICDASSYTFNGTSYSTAGSYIAHLTNAAGCDSAATLVLTVKSKSVSTTNASICDGGSYTFNGTSYSTAGSYTAHLTNAAGCDSAATLVLTVKSKSASTTNVSICSGGSYPFNGTSYSKSGSYTSHITNAAGCDSAATLILTVKSASTSTTNASICDGSSYTFNGTSYSTAGSYTAHLSNAAGCDSAATLVLTVKSKSASTTNASICDGSSYTFNGTSYSTAGSYTAHLTNAAGCDSAATLVLTKKLKSVSTTNASICSGGSYTFNGTNYKVAGSYTVHLTNAAGCDSAATLVLTVKAAPIVGEIEGDDNTNKETKAHLSEDTKGGSWSCSDDKIAKVDDKGEVTGISEGKTKIHYTVTVDGCTVTKDKDFEVKEGCVSSGGTGGLESKSLGAAIGTRNFNIYKNSKNGAVQYNESERIVAPKKGSYQTFGASASRSLATLMPYSVSAAYVPYDKSAEVADLTSITNAVDVRTIDFTLNNSPRAVAFATKTIGGIYSHTKPICDRLKGAQLLNIENTSIQNISFIRYTILQPDGNTEYAISFSAGQKAGRSTMSIQSNWLMPDYASEDTMYNYQLWASTKADVTAMVSEIINKLQATMPVSQLRNSNDMPGAYVSAASRQGANLNLTVNNRTANTIGYFQLKQNATEASAATTTQLIPFTIAANGKTTVSIPVGDAYDANISMIFNNSTTDMLYIADGIWGTSGDNATKVSQFTVSNSSTKEVASNEYPLLRDVQVQVTTPSYVSIYKYLKGGAAAVDLSAYKSFHFTASTNTEGMNMTVTITKQSVGKWASQYTYTINNVQDGQAYDIALSSFKSVDGTLPATIDVSDVTSVVYNVINTTGQSLNIKAGISNAAFSTTDIAYQQALQVKTVGVSPNPNNGSFKVSFASASNLQLRLAIVDITGRIVSSTMVNAVTGKNEVAVNLGQTTKGNIYFVSLQGAGTKYTTQKMLIK